MNGVCHDQQVRLTWQFEAGCSLVPHRELDFHAVDELFLLSLGREELTKQSFVVGVVKAHLAGLHVLPLRVVDALLGDDLATDQQHALDLEIGLLVEHANLTEGELSEGFQPLEETFEEVLELVSNLAFLTEFVIVKEPEGPTRAIKLIQELIKACSLLIWHIDVVCLKVEEVEGCGWQSIKWVDHLLLLLSSWLGFGSSLGTALSLRGLLFGLDDGLEGLLGHLDAAEDADELGNCGNARKPSTGLRGGLSEALVKNELEGYREHGCEDDIGNRAASANDPVTSKGTIDSTEVLFDGLDGVVELGLSDFGGAAEDGHKGGVSTLANSLDPSAPLIDLSALNSVSAEESIMAVGEELGDGGALR